MAIELHVDHRCVLVALTEHLADRASQGDCGERLGAEALAALANIDMGAFERCCAPVYLGHAPERFDREIQVPIASAEAGRLDTRVLLWPVGATDGHHPHNEGWAAFAAASGRLAVSEEREGVRLPDRLLQPGVPELIRPAEDVSHHIHNRGDVVGLTIHIFGA